MRFVIADQEFMGSMRAAIIPIWAGDERELINVRLVQGESELLLGLGIFEKIGLWVDFRKS